MYILINSAKFVHLYNQQYNQDTNVEHFLNLSSLSISLGLSPKQPLIWFLSPWSRFIFSRVSCKGVIQYVFFCVWPLLLNIMFFRVIRVAYINSSFSFCCEIIAHYINISQFVYPFAC